jgi:SNF2 family DNA or RNA helicase
MTEARITMALAGNGVPVFSTVGQSRELSRPFGATWDGGRHLWLYPAYFPVAKKVLSDFEVLSRELRVVFSDVVKEYIKQLEDTEDRYNRQVLPEGFDFVTKPFAHQLLGLAHVYYMPRAALFYDPGLGKSKVAIDLLRLLRFLGQRSPSVIMGPLTSILNWGKEIDRHSGQALRWGAVLGTRKRKTKIIEKAAAGELDVLLLTYETNSNFVDLIFREVPYDKVVADESHLIKEWKANRTKAAFELVQKAQRRVLMTGTPTLGSPLDLYGQFKFLADYFMPEPYHQYKKRYLEVSSSNKWLVTGYKNLDVLNARTQLVSLRKTKDECLDLPPRTMVDVEYELSRHQTAVYNQLVAEMQIDVEALIRALRGVVKDALPPSAIMPHAAARLNKLFQVASGFLITNNMDPKLCDHVDAPFGCQHLPDCVKEEIKPYTRRCKVAPEKIPDTVTVFEENPKLEALVELLDTVLGNPGNKVIVWCHYWAELDIVEARLKELDLSYVRVDGSTGARTQGIVDRFNEDPSLRVYLGQISTGVSITINSAAYMIYYALTFSLKDWLQSVDRNYRIGQSKNVTTYRLLGKQTVEPCIVHLLDNKVDVDNVLTQKLSCIVCPHSLRCTAERIELFDAGCIYSRSMSRSVTRAQLIQVKEET